MPSLYDSVGDKPTYELAEIIIKAAIQELKQDSKSTEDFSITPEYSEYSLKRLGHRKLSRFLLNNSNDMAIAIQLIINHFPIVLKKSDNTVYINTENKHLLMANDLLVLDYYLLLLKQYEERVSNYQRYLDKQQFKQQAKFLFVVAFPFILFVLMILVGD